MTKRNKVIYVYMLVENAGYEGEWDVCGFSHYEDAAAYLERRYPDLEERAALHVGIRADYDNGDQEYVG